MEEGRWAGRSKPKGEVAKVGRGRESCGDSGKASAEGRAGGEGEFSKPGSQTLDCCVGTPFPPTQCSTLGTNENLGGDSPSLSLCFLLGETGTRRVPS